jgi:hypothetical protein
LSRLTSTLAAVAALGAIGLLAGPATDTTRVSPSADVLPAPAIATRWSPPASVSSCPAAGAARAVFPSDSPDRATGPGAIVWSASAACPGGEGARVSALGSGDAPGAPLIPRTAAGQALELRAPLTATAAPHGQIAIAGAPSASAGGALIQGAAAGPFSRLGPSGGVGEPVALATAYLGDMAMAAPASGPLAGRSLNVHVERFFADSFVRNVSARGSARGTVQALTLAMDFRSEALAVWAQGGALYASLAPSRGPARRVQRLASIGAHPHIAAVLSDDNRAIVAWSEQLGTQTSVYIDRSLTGVRFRAPQLLERFQDPDGIAAPAGSPSLVRMSSESVMLAWAGSEGGHWVVRSAPVDLNGVQLVSTIAAPGADALLADLAAGPDDDALLLWTEPLPTAGGVPDMERQAIFAARGVDTGPGRARFGEPEQVAPPAPVSQATVALDPSDDGAVAVWQGEAATVEYSIRSAGAGTGAGTDANAGAAP